MALASALQGLTADGAVRLTNLGAYLAMHPPTGEVDIRERTSWSCPHGVERWRADCGDRTDPNTHQRWRAPVREAMTWLKQELDRLYEQHGSALLKDPWAARDDAIDLIDPEPGALEAFFGRHATTKLSTEQRSTALLRGELGRSEEHTSELQSLAYLVCRLLLE